MSAEDRLNRYREQFRGMPDEKLYRRLHLSVRARTIRYVEMAAMVAILDERKVDLSAIHVDLLWFLRRIVSGVLDAAFAQAMREAGLDFLLLKMEVPREHQYHLVQGGTLAVAQRNGAVVHRSLKDVTPMEFQQAMSRDGPVPVERQREQFRRHKSRPVAEELQPDPVSDGFWIGGKLLPAASMQAAIIELENYEKGLKHRRV